MFVQATELVRPSQARPSENQNGRGSGTGTSYFQREEDEEAKARGILQPTEDKKCNTFKSAFAAAAKKARNWRMIGKLNPAEVTESEGKKRLLKRV
ncbi:hypothetical protein VTI74DRAFT_7397 [Chaetomium olivicolor]